MSRGTALGWLEESLASLAAADRLRTRSERSGPLSSRLCWNGERLVSFASNDYLGLAAAGPAGWHLGELPAGEGWAEIGLGGAGASPLIVGRSQWHAGLEAELAEFEGTESALLFPSGFAANQGTVPALVGRGDIIFSDALNHASLIDGCRLSGARIQVYPHVDLDYLRLMLPQASGFRRRLIISDSLFSMHGDVAPLADLAALAEAHDAMLLVDEAHATGVFGRGGRGLAEQQGVEDGVHVRVGTLSKALGAAGGFVVGSGPLIEWLRNSARSYMFSTATPDCVAAVAWRNLRWVRAHPGEGRELLDSAAEYRDQLREDGWEVGDSQSQIVPLWIGESAAAVQLAAALRGAGVLVPAIRPPTVPEGGALLRVSLTRSHGEADLRQLREVLLEAAKHLPGGRP